MATYEMTVKVSHISTSTKGRTDLSATDAVGAAKANLRYITRDDAAEAGNVIARTNGQFIEGTTDDLKRAARDSIEKRAEKHNDAYGVRLADKMVVSLPNDATIAEQREMCGDILTAFTADSEAFGIAAIHTDKSGNAHAHFLFVDGLETREAALARRPDAKRVRRADQLRMNEGGNRQEIRATVAGCVNRISAENGRRIAEVRSFKDRGIEREPQKHEGPQISDKLDRYPESPLSLTTNAFKRLKANAISLRQRLEREAIPGASISNADIPARQKKGWLGGAWFNWLRQTNQARTKGQDKTTEQDLDAGVDAFVADWSKQAPEAAHRSGPRTKPPTPSTAIQTPARGAPDDEERRKAALAFAKERARHTPHPPPVIEPKRTKNRSRNRSR